MMSLVDAWIKSITGSGFMLAAAWIIWHGRNYGLVTPGYLAPVMCFLVAITFALTGLAFFWGEEQTPE